MSKGTASVRGAVAGAEEGGGEEEIDVETIPDVRLRVIVLLLRGVAIPGVGLRAACVKCGNEEKPLQCNCQLVSYCSEGCSKEHWPSHGHEHALLLAKDDRLDRLVRGGTLMQVLAY